MSNMFTNTLEEIVSGKGDRPNCNIKTIDDVLESIDDIYKNGHRMGTTTHLSPLDPHLRWRKGFLYTFTGWPSVGKSTFLNYLLVLRAKNDGTKIAIYSPEMLPVEESIEELMLQYCAFNLAPNFGNQMDESMKKDAIEFIREHFFFLDFGYNIPTQQHVFNEFQTLVDTKGCEICVIDPFNSLVEGSNTSGNGNMSVFLKGALTQAKNFAVQSDVSVVVIEHPRSAGVNKAEDLPAPTPWMINGGQMFFNKSDIIVVVDRDLVANDPYVKVRIWKVKKQRLMGKPGEVTLNYDWFTCRYS